jgi:hypothetical protein
MVGPSPAELRRVSWIGHDIRHGSRPRDGFSAMGSDAGHIQACWGQRRPVGRIEA